MPIPRRLIAIGDIHGQSRQLIELIVRIRPQDDDLFVFLGDYIDRGPDSPEVIDLLRAFQLQYPRSIFLRGNHEQMLIDAYTQLCPLARNYRFRWDELPTNEVSDEVLIYLLNGGSATLDSYQELPEAVRLGGNAILPEHFDFLNRTCLYFRFDNYFFVHAGVDPSLSFGTEAAKNVFLWSRRALWLKDPDWRLTVVHGHSPVAQPEFKKLEVCLDTGAGHGYNLTACDLYTRKIWQA